MSNETLFFLNTQDEQYCFEYCMILNLCQAADPNLAKDKCKKDLRHKGLDEDEQYLYFCNNIIDITLSADAIAKIQDIIKADHQKSSGINTGDLND